MRKTLPVLAVLFAVTAAGIGFSQAGIGPVIGLALGLVCIGGIALTRVSTDRIVLFAVSVLILTITWNGIRTAGGALGNAFMVLGFLAVVADVAITRRKVPLPPWFMLAALGFLAAGILNLVFPPNPELTNRADLHLEQVAIIPVYLPARNELIQLIKFEATIVIIPLLMMMAGSTRRRCLFLMDVWTVSALVSALVGLADYAGVHIAPKHIAGTRSAGLTIHPNYLALASVMALPTAMLWIVRPGRWRIAGAVAMPVLLGGVFVSGSRAGAVVAVAVVAATVIVVPALRRVLIGALPVAGMVLVLLVMFTSFGTQVIEQVRLNGDSTTTSGSDYERTNAAKIAISQIRERPISGVGYSVIADAHDIYLEMLASGGIIAMASFFTFFGGLGVSARRGLRGPMRPEVSALSIAVVAWLVNGVLDNQLADKYLYVVPGLLMAMALLPREPEGEAAPTGAAVLPEAVTAARAGDRAPVMA